MLVDWPRSIRVQQMGKIMLNVSSGNPVVGLKSKRAKFAIAVAVFFAIFGIWTLPAQAKVTRYLAGSAVDVDVRGGPALVYGGGGPDVDESLQWAIDRVRGCTDCSATVDVVVVRTSGGAGYNEAILALNGVDSVETLEIASRQDANDRDVVDALSNAEFIFFAGGDQCEYTRNFRGTGVEKAVKSVFAKGGAIGGTSAGAMIQSEIVYNACSNTVESEDALEDPYEDLLFSYNLFQWPNMNNTILDTHFYDRDRMGRLMAFVARQIRDGKAESALGIGVDEDTSVVVDKNGLAQVMGNGIAYFVLGDHIPEVCEPQTPLTFSDYKIWKVRSGDTFNLKNRPTRGYYLVSVSDGQLKSDPY